MRLVLHGSNQLPSTRPPELVETLLLIYFEPRPVPTVQDRPPSRGRAPARGAGPVRLATAPILCKAASPANFDSAPRCRTASSSARAWARIVRGLLFSVARSASRSLSTLFRELEARGRRSWPSTRPASASLNDFSAVLCLSSASPRSRPRLLNDAFSTSNCVLRSLSSSKSLLRPRCGEHAPHPACARISARARSEVAFSVCKDERRDQPGARLPAARPGGPGGRPTTASLEIRLSASREATLDWRERFSTSSASPLDSSRPSGRRPAPPRRRS